VFLALTGHPAEPAAAPDDTEKTPELNGSPQ
jgi:hypothetical protein